MTQDIWPEIDVEKTVPVPTTILHEQSKLLAKKTRDLLKVVVNTRPAPGDSSQIAVHADIRAGRLFYQLPFLVIKSSLMSPYPATLYDAGNQTTYEVKDEIELLDRLKEIAGTEHWRQVIDRLVTLSASVAKAG